MTHLPMRPDTPRWLIVIGASAFMIAVSAWLSNFLVIVGCVWAYQRLPGKTVSDLVGLAIAFMLTTGFFAADMACFSRAI